MANPLFIRDDQVRPSSNPKEAAQLRPTSDKPWESKPEDKTPSVAVVFDQPSRLGSIDLPKLSNVEKVTIVFKPDVFGKKIVRICF